MPSQKSNDSNINDSNAINQKLNFFSEHINSVQHLQLEHEHRINNQNYTTAATNHQIDHQDIRSMNQPNQSELDYYQEFKKIYLISYHLSLQKIKQVEMKLALQKRIKIVQDKLRDIQKQQAPKKDSSQQNRIKRSRRTADAIQRRFKCNVEFCQRCYGSEGSLQQHIKLKHPQLYKKYQQRQYSVSQ